MYPLLHINCFIAYQCMSPYVEEYCATLSLCTKTIWRNVNNYTIQDDHMSIRFLFHLRVLESFG
jgi:hypothetical protein